MRVGACAVPRRGRTRQHEMTAVLLHFQRRQPLTEPMFRPVVWRRRLASLYDLDPGGEGEGHPAESGQLRRGNAGIVVDEDPNAAANDPVIYGVRLSGPGWVYV